MRRLRSALEAQRDAILRATRHLLQDVKHPPTEDGTVLDEAERSEADIQEELDVALIEMYGETLAQIDEALDQIARGDYGACIECGDAIGARRLEALPLALRCVSCEERREAVAPPHEVCRTWRASINLLDRAER